MSTNDPARPRSNRRTFLTAGAAVLTGAASVGAAATASAGTDPAFALLAAEQAAWDAYTVAIDAEQAAEVAAMAAGVDRKPRVQTGEVTSFVSEHGHTLPDDERVPVAVYAYSREEVRRAYAGQPNETVHLSIGEAREARIVTSRRKTLAEALTEFEADERAIETAPETLAYLAAERARVVACDAHDAALLALVSAVPTTPAGLLAAIERFEEREADGISDVVGIPELLASVRSFLAGRA